MADWREEHRKLLAQMRHMRHLLDEARKESARLRAVSERQREAARTMMKQFSSQPVDIATYRQRKARKKKRA